MCRLMKRSYCYLDLLESRMELTVDGNSSASDVIS